MARSLKRASSWAGYFLIDARNLDEAIDIAGQIPAGRYGTVENPAGRRSSQPSRNLIYSACRFVRLPFDLLVEGRLGGV
jgi:hypothetical protein